MNPILLNAVLVATGLLGGILVTAAVMFRAQKKREEANSRLLYNTMAWKIIENPELLDHAALRSLKRVLRKYNVKLGVWDISNEETGLREVPND